MRKKGAWSEVKYTAAAATVAREGRGRATYKAEERVRQGKGLDSLVDPKERGVIRGSNTLMVPKGDQFEMPFGVAMPVMTDVDTTGSMGSNVDKAFAVQPQVQRLLVQGDGAVLSRYHTQMATGVIQDVSDRFPYQRSMFEPDNEVERQMGLLVPERGGGDPEEDYQLSLFAAAYLTKATITQYGLRGYYFAAGDEIGRNTIASDDLKRVFGADVYKLAGLPDSQDLTTATVAKKLLENWHGFYLQVDENRYTTEWWANLIGAERIVKLPRTEDLAMVQAVIIGLTEGSLTVQSAADFLLANEVSKAEVPRIVEACANIPVGLQTTFDNFDKIPMAGAVFASRDDIWPIGTKGVATDDDDLYPVDSDDVAPEDEPVVSDDWRL